MKFSSASAFYYRTVTVRVVGLLLPAFHGQPGSPGQRTIKCREQRAAITFRKLEKAKHDAGEQVQLVRLPQVSDLAGNPRLFVFIKFRDKCDFYAQPAAAAAAREILRRSRGGGIRQNGGHTCCHC